MSENDDGRDTGANDGGVPPEDLMRYDLLVEAALKQVVEFALARAQREGLPGEHHFYIAFDTRHPGVVLADRLRAKYPEEMTIVLQHQFWNLRVFGDRFEVGLSFGGIPEKLVIPFAAITGFYDPHVQFALQFRTERERDDEELALLDLARRPARDTEEGDGGGAEGEGAAGAVRAEDGKEGEKVVSLDAFRKKT